MKLTANDILVLRALASYYVLSASRVHRICFQNNSDQRATRRRLARLVADRYIARSAVQVAFSTGNAGPAYYLAPRGSEALAIWFDDDLYLSANTRPPRLDRLFHWLDIAEMHWIVEQAVASHPDVQLVGFINEWQTIVTNEPAPTADRFVLHTQFSQGPHPLSCSPDAAFLLDVRGYRRVFYLEIDRGTTGVKRVAASKTPGYAELARTLGHRRHFPETSFDDFTVLLVTIDAGHRNRLADEVAKQSTLRPDLWLFLDQHDVKPESLLYGEITYNCRREVGSLLRKPALEAALPATTDEAHS